jgi:hypothetical protein
MQQIVRMASILDDRVTNVIPLADKGILEIYVDVGESPLIPLPLMGTGFFNALSIAAATASTNNGVVLIDEIEDGVHYLSFSNSS